MKQDEILDVPAEQKKRFNKNAILYALVTLVIIGFLFKRMHWPFSAQLLVFGGGIGVGYSVALLVYFRQHFMFENLGLALYVSSIAIYIFKIFNLMSFGVFGATAAIVAVPMIFFLRGKEID